MSTSSAATSISAIAPEKSHFVVLDGLRGVASLMVLLFHLFEAHAFDDAQHQILNHGYLAVDFFFLLSGFVIAYAYDGRWGDMTTWGFVKRRLIRLQPMIVVGSVIGAALFYFQAGPVFPLIAATSGWQLLLVMLMGCVMLPLPKAFDVRGWDEMYPLNGPAWSLFFEYYVNLLYAIGLRRLPNRLLAILTLLAAAALWRLAVFGHRGDLIGGWALDGNGLQFGFTRVMFPFLAGMLLMRLGWRVRVRGAFGVCALLLVVLLALPRFGGPQHLWINGLYEATCVTLAFPLIVAIGAGEKRADGMSIRIARFFGDISYPLYITHYPLIYLYTAWVIATKPPLAQSIAWGAAVFVAAVLIAYASLKFLDEPARRWLARRYLASGASGRRPSSRHGR